MVGAFRYEHCFQSTRRCTSRFGMVPGDAVFPSTIISVAINWNANLKLISDAALVASRRISL